MKELTQGGPEATAGVFTESDGDPLPHDEWMKQQAKADAAALKRKEQERDSRVKARRASAEGEGDAAGEGEESPVSDTNAAEAIDSVNRMRSRDKLQHVIDNDPRATVRAAAEKRLGDL